MTKKEFLSTSHTAASPEMKKMRTDLPSFAYISGQNNADELDNDSILLLDYGLEGSFRALPVHQRNFVRHRNRKKKVALILSFHYSAYTI